MSACNIEVAIALVWQGERLLITRRVAGSHLAGYWEFPGGKLLPGEAAEAAAEREVLEEVGIACSAESRRPKIQYSYPDRAVTLYPIDCRWLRGTPECRKVAEFEWIQPPELTNFAFPPANAALIAELTRTFRSR